MKSTPFHLFLKKAQVHFYVVSSMLDSGANTKNEFEYDRVSPVCSFSTKCNLVHITCQ